MSDAVGSRCMAYLEDLMRATIANPTDCPIAQLSTALGVVETCLTAKGDGKQQWPEDLPQQVEACLEAVWGFSSALHERLRLQQLDARGKVKAVADAVWAKLAGSFSADVPHAQHVSNFARLLSPGGGAAAKRQLDCAGVTTSTFVVCARLASAHGHEDLRQLRVCIAEDHCFLSLDPGGGRDGSVEVTADTAAKRGLPPAEELWRGWIYAGGHPVVCTAQQLAAAVVTSVNPAISGGKKGSDSAELQHVQQRLLSMLYDECPRALYPAALCALADLREIQEQDAAETAVAAGDAATAERLLLQRREGDARALFEEAIAAARAPAEPDGGPHAPRETDAACGGPLGGAREGWHWYPYSYVVAFLCRRAELHARCAAAFPLHAAPYEHSELQAIRQALRWAAEGSGVLAKYRFLPTDDQLYKDVGEGTLEACADALAAYSKRRLGGKAIDDSSLLGPVLTLFDGICLLFAGKPKPTAWVAIVLRCGKLFTPEARLAAAAAATARSEPMQRARPLWGALKPAVLRPLFESADVAGGAERGSKRQRV